EAVKLDASSIRAKGTLARAYSALKQDEKALPLWAAAVAGEPNEPTWAGGQIQTLAALHKSEEAVAAATKARTNFPKDEPTAVGGAGAGEQPARNPDAEEAYRAAAQLAPPPLAAALGLARLYPRQRRNPDARSTLAVVTEKRPQAPRL